MFDSIYIGLSGLTGFAEGLRNISNNVANVNTPGFKGTELKFKDLFYRVQSGVGNGSDEAGLFLGSGLETGGSTIVFRQGEVKSTGNDLDAGIEGNGFFVLHRDGKTLFTRDGQFSVDAEGFLVSRGDKARVQGIVGGALQDLNINELRVSPGKPTATVKFAGDLSVNDSDKEHQVSVTVFDQGGASHALSVTFAQKKTDPNDLASPRDPTIWTILIEESGNLVDDTGEIRFQGNTPIAGFNTHTFTFAPLAGGVPPSSITFDFGEAGGFGGVTNFSGATASSVSATTQDGFAAGALTKTTFDADGKLALTYSNGQTGSHGQLALAWFDFLQGLEPSGQASFENSAGLAVRIGAPRTSLFGSVKSGSLESSNVDLSQEFTDLIVVQRGYQASSQVLTVANEMIQQLLDIQGGRG